MKRWPLNKAYFWEQLPFFRILLPFIIGIITYTLVNNVFSIHTGISFSLVLAALYYLVSFKKKNTLLSFITANTFFIVCAWVLCYVSDVKNSTKWFGNYLGKDKQFIATIIDQPIEKDKTIKLIVNVDSALTDKESIHTKGNAFVYVYKHSAPAYKEGDKLLLPNNWLPITNRGNPFEFDYKEYTARQNIFYQQFTSAKEIKVTNYAQVKDLNWVRQMHYWSIDQLEYYIHDLPTLSMLKAMLLGDKSQLDKRLQQTYTDTGIVHILAISGGHITIFFIITSILFIWIKHRKYHWIKLLGALPLIWLYVLIAGAPASAVRAATMFSIIAIGFSLQKQNNGINQLLVAAFILLCYEPNWLYSIGFQLSFAAVLSIFIFYKPINALLKPKSVLLQYLWSAISVSLAAEILVAPIVIFHFNHFPLLFIVANVLAYCFMSITLVVGLFIIAASPFYTLAKILSDGIVTITNLFNKLIAFLSSLNPEAFQTIVIDKFQLFFVYLLILFIYLSTTKRKRSYYTITIVTLVILFSSAIYTSYKHSNQELLIIYNIKKGNHIEYIKGRKSYLISKGKNISEETNQYILKPAHTNLKIEQTIQEINYRNIYKIGNNTIYILNNSKVDSNLSTDYVIVNTREKIDLQEITNKLSPKKLIIGTNISKRKAQNLIENCKEINLKTHYIPTDGAFIISK